MALPQKTAEIEKLGESLADRNHEASSLQEAMSAFTIGDDEELTSDDYMMRELDALLDMPISPRAQLPVAIEKAELPVPVPVPVPVPAVDIEKAELPVPVPAAPKQLITVLASAQFS